MSRYIFLDDADRGFLAMREERYENEALLQQLVERYPELLNDDAATDAGRRAFLLVQSEAALADTADGAATFSVDHHFLDATGIPTLVEVKRSQDTRIRRSVIGQMLDYAARAAVEWTAETIRRDFERTCAKANQDHEAVLIELIGEDADPDEYWALVGENLTRRRIRLVLVADEIPIGTRRVIEYLNTEMQNTEVIGIEIRRYRDPRHGVSALVPRALAASEQVKARKAATHAPIDKRVWDRRGFLEAVAASNGEDALRVAERIMRFADEHGWSTVYSAPGTKGAARIGFGAAEAPVRFLHLYTSGRIALAFDQLLRTAPAFASDDSRMQLMERIEQCTGADLKGKYAGATHIPMESLADDEVITAFLALMVTVSQDLGE
jgi:hypothetical protein